MFSQISRRYTIFVNYLLFICYFSIVISLTYYRWRKKFSRTTKDSFTQSCSIWSDLIYFGIYITDENRRSKNSVSKEIARQFPIKYEWNFMMQHHISPYKQNLIGNKSYFGKYRSKRDYPISLGNRIVLQLIN